MDQLLAQPQHQQISFQDSKQGMSSGRRDIQHIHIHKLHSMDQLLAQLLVQHQRIFFQGSKQGMCSGCRDIPTPTTHTLLTTLEKDPLMLNQKLSQKLIHTILPTMDMLDMVVDITVIHMGLTTLESKSKTEKRSKD